MLAPSTGSRAPAAASARVALGLRNNRPLFDVALQGLQTWSTVVQPAEAAPSRRAPPSQLTEHQRVRHGRRPAASARAQLCFLCLAAAHTRSERARARARRPATMPVYNFKTIQPVPSAKVRRAPALSRLRPLSQRRCARKCNHLSARQQPVGKQDFFFILLAEVAF